MHSKKIIPKKLSILTYDVAVITIDIGDITL